MHKQTVDPPRIARVNNKLDRVSRRLLSLSILPRRRGYTHLPFSWIRIKSRRNCLTQPIDTPIRRFLPRTAALSLLWSTVRTINEPLPDVGSRLHESINHVQDRRPRIIVPLFTMNTLEPV